MKDNWKDNELQFARLINELNAYGTFEDGTHEMEHLKEAMELTDMEIWNIVNRAEQKILNFISNMRFSDS